MKLSSLVVLFAASGDAKPTPEARAALKAKKNTQDLAWELLFNSGMLNSDKMGFIDVGDKSFLSPEIFTASFMYVRK